MRRYLLPSIFQTVQFPTVSAEGNVPRRSLKLRHSEADIWVNQARRGTWASGWIAQNSRKRFSDTTHMGSLRNDPILSMFDIREHVKLGVRHLRMDTCHLGFDSNSTSFLKSSRSRSGSRSVSFARWAASL